MNALTPVEALRLSHYSSKPLSAIKSGRQSVDSYPYAPKPNGFWVSVCGEDDWLSWCKAEGFMLHRLAFENVIELKEGSNILCVSSAEEIDDLTAKYGLIGLPNSCLSYASGIDWERLAKLYQGIIIAPYIWARRLDGGSDWYYGWDCASGCIWDATCIDGVKTHYRSLASSEATP